MNAPIGEYAPPVLNLVVISAEAVDALDTEQITRLQEADELLPVQSLEILARLPVREYLRRRYRKFEHGNRLSVLVLVGRR
jgi:hypothetical protein